MLQPIRLFFTLYGLLFSLSSFAGVLDPRPQIIDQHYQFTYDALRLSDGEHMGLVGGNFILDFSPSWYGGLGIYGAVTGVRGGFFTGGFDAGWRQTWWSRWSSELGVFAGGGGGGGAPQGGGLMLRPHAQWEYSWSRARAFLGLSRVWFPNGDIQSDQVYGGFSLSFSSILLPGVADVQSPSISDVLANSEWTAQPTRFFVESTSYRAIDHFLGRSGLPRGGHVELVGVRWQSQLSPNIWSDFSTHGALGGQADGYAQVMAGLYYRTANSTRWHLGAGAMLGAAGGGDIDTGGGSLARASVVADWQSIDDWLLQLEFGWTHALDGNFDAPTSVISVGRSYETVSLVKEGSSTGSGVEWGRFDFRVSSQRYASFQGGNGRKTPTARERAIDMVGLKIDRQLGRLFVTGQAYGAYDGDAGGYAVGMLGGGGRIFRSKSFGADAELLGGAAGGGGVDVGSGLILQPMVNFNVLLSPSLELALASGYVAAVNGALRAWVWDVGLRYSFSLPYVTDG